MKKIDFIVVHCTATPQNTKIDAIVNYWRKVLNWKNNGYHFIIDKNGLITDLTPIEKIANGVKNHNANSIHISYIGGIDEKGNPKDTRTLAQKNSLIYKLRELKIKFPNAKIQGHRDFEGVQKACPCFDAIPEYENITDVFG